MIEGRSRLLFWGKFGACVKGGKAIYRYCLPKFIYFLESLWKVMIFSLFFSNFCLLTPLLLFFPHLSIFQIVFLHLHLNCQ